MARAIDVGVLGATGAVGQQFIARLERHPWFRLRWVAASGRSAGRRFGDLPWRLSTPCPDAVRDLVVGEARPGRGPQLLFSALDAAVAEGLEPEFAGAGHVIVSNTRCYRMDPTVPLVVPEINPDHLRLLPGQRVAHGWSGAIVTNPNCSTTILALALGALAEFGLRTVMVSTLQAVSGAGYPGVASLDLLGNVIPFIDGEEPKIECEANKILGRLVNGQVEPHPLVISAQATRVPVLDGHTELVSIAFENSPSVRGDPPRVARFQRQPPADATAERSGAANSAHGRARSSATAPRRRGRRRNGRDRRTRAPLPGARLEDGPARAQHRSRRRGRSAPERRTAGGGRAGRIGTTMSQTKPEPGQHHAGPPRKQGLYNPRFEHDACGLGLVVDIGGKRSNQIVRQALTVLANLTHRGARGAEPNTGDGAGILIQVPHAFLRRKADRHGYSLPGPGHYGVGMVFLPPDVNHRRAIEIHFEKIVASEGQRVIGWRTVKVNNGALGRTARRAEPKMRMIFVARNPAIADDMAFERRLYVIRKRAENEIRYGGTLEGGEFFYIASLSHRTLIYKGMFVSDQLEGYFRDLAEPDLETSLALVHSRFSTNTFPSWELAHPYRYVVHNGEINTLRGNVNWLRAQEHLLESDLFGSDIKKVLPIMQPDGSDTAMFDNCLEFLLLTGRSLPHVMTMMIPEPWSRHEDMEDEKRAFYEYHANLMEPWDGPAAMGFTDGVMIGAVLDRNGLRPARYYVTTDDLIVMASEVGVLEIPPEKVAYKGRLEPGKMLLVDTGAGRIISDEEIKHDLASAYPYRDWLDKYQVRLQDIADPKPEDRAAARSGQVDRTASGRLAIPTKS